MRHRRNKVVPRNARGWTKPSPSGRVIKAFRGRLFVSWSSPVVKFSEPKPWDRYWIGVDRSDGLSWSAEYQQEPWPADVTARETRIIDDWVNARKT